MKYKMILNFLGTIIIPVQYWYLVLYRVPVSNILPVPIPIVR